jgi:hypothetical protein
VDGLNFILIVKRNHWGIFKPMSDRNRFSLWGFTMSAVWREDWCWVQQTLPLFHAHFLLGIKSLSSWQLFWWLEQNVTPTSNGSDPENVADVEFPHLRRTPPIFPSTLPFSSGPWHWHDGWCPRGYTEPWMMRPSVWKPLPNHCSRKIGDWVPHDAMVPLYLPWTGSLHTSFVWGRKP